MITRLRIVPLVVVERPLLAAWPRIERLEDEPSLTLCSTSRYFEAVGPLGQTIGGAVARSPRFAKLSAAQGSGWAIRWTSQLLWVLQGEVPAARQEWHVDRVGPGWTGPYGEVLDLLDNVETGDEDLRFGAVSYFWPDAHSQEASGDGVASLATEFLLEHLTVPLPRLADDPRTLGRAVGQRVAALGTSPTVATYGSNVLTWFGAHTLHRPPVADRSGWRFFLRVGLHREPHSPYSDHRLQCHRLWDTAAQKTVFRPTGTQVSLDTWSRPLSEPVAPCG